MCQACSRPTSSNPQFHLLHIRQQFLRPTTWGQSAPSFMGQASCIACTIEAVSWNVKASSLPLCNRRHTTPRVRGLREHAVLPNHDGWICFASGLAVKRSCSRRRWTAPAAVLRMISPGAKARETSLQKNTAGGGDWESWASQAQG